MGPKERLNQYLDKVSSEPFVWGKHDCLVFSNNAFKEYWGFGYAEDWLGKYMLSDRVMRADEMRKFFRFSTLESALDSKLTRCSATKYGSLVTTLKNQRWVTKVALGISVGSRCLFLSKQGMITLNATDTNGAWIPNEK